MSPFGNVERITGGGQTTEYEYDEFERLIRSKGPGETDSSWFEYDGLDRRDAKCKGARVDACTSTSKVDFSYVGTSQQLASEKGAGQDKSYDYTADGERLGQWSKADGDTSAKYKTYAQDANGSVEGLEGEGGSIPTGDRYDYDPYGQLDRRRKDDGSGDFQDADPESALSEDAKENPFRFQGFYYDSGVKIYDMQARNYRPEIGRFLTADRFESSSGDFNLEADPLTSERYAFVGGNPVNRIEFDGHEPASSFYTDPSYCGANCRGDPRSRPGRRDAQRRQAAVRYRKQTVDNWKHEVQGQRACNGGGQCFRQPLMPSQRRERREQSLRAPLGEQGLMMEKARLKPTPEDECSYISGCDNPIRSPERESEVRGTQQTLVDIFIGSSPAEVALNAFPGSRLLNVARKFGAAAKHGAQTVRGVVRAQRAFRSFAKAGPEAQDALMAAFKPDRKGKPSVAVIGGRVDAGVAKRWSGHHVLSLPDDQWSWPLNQKWVEGHIANRRPVYLASPDVARGQGRDLSNFGQEYEMFKGAGYKRRGDYLLPPD